jgi:hypothetical protein
MPLVLSGSVDISGSIAATTIVVSAPGVAGMVSSSAQIRELAPLMAYTASIKAASIVSSSAQLNGNTITNLTVTNLTTVGQTGGYVSAFSGYVNETQTITTNGTSYYLRKSTGTSNGSSGTVFNITGLSTSNGTFADIYAIAQKDATGNAINTNLEVQINGQYMVGIQANGTGANTAISAFRVCRMESSWIIIGTVRT